jgi:predicted membrane channel-forming protein YqfA (hemolysin III family)
MDDDDAVVYNVDGGGEDSVFPAAGSVHEFGTRKAKYSPGWMHIKFIHSGYRVGFSKKLCAASIWRLHNETGNIWTHLLGAALFLMLFVRLFWVVVPQIPNDVPAGDMVVMCFFYASGFFCLACSSIYHTGRCYSEPAYWYVL